MKLKKIFICLLAISMLLAVLSGCNSGKLPEEPSKDSDNKTTEENEDSENPNLAPIDGENNTFNIWVRQAGNDYLFKYSEVQDTEDYSDNVNNAVFSRNMVLEEKYKIIITTKQNTSYNSAAFVGDLEKNELSGDQAYDMVMPMIECAFFAACKGLLTEWSLIPYVDETKSYWMGELYDSTTIGGYQFNCPGASNLSAYNTVQVMFFNKAMHESLGLDNIYDAVRNGIWTQETMYEMAELATQDVDGLGMDSEDIYGVVSGTVCWQSYFYASGKTLVTKDSAGTPSLTGLSERLSDTVDKISYIITQMNDGSQAGISTRIGWSGQVPERFTQNQCLFFVEGIYGQYKILDMKNDYGIVPIPTWEADADYYSFVHSTHSSTCAIPKDVRDLNLSGSVMEDMAYHSQQIVLPEYYEKVIHLKNVRDAESYEMLDIVFEHIIIDLAQVMKSTGLTLDDDIRRLVQNNQTDTISSTLEGGVEVYASIVRQLAAAFTQQGALQYQ